MRLHHRDEFCTHIKDEHYKEALRLSPWLRNFTESLLPLGARDERMQLNADILLQRGIRPGKPGDNDTVWKLVLTFAVCLYRDVVAENGTQVVEFAGLSATEISRQSR